MGNDIDTRLYSDNMAEKSSESKSDI